MENYSSTKNKIKTIWDTYINKSNEQISYEEALKRLAVYFYEYSSVKISFVEKSYEINWAVETDREKLVHLKVSDRLNVKVRLAPYLNGNYLISVVPVGMDSEFFWWTDEEGDFCFYSSIPVAEQMKIYIFVFNIY